MVLFSFHFAPVFSGNRQGCAESIFVNNMHGLNNIRFKQQKWTRHIMMNSDMRSDKLKRLRSWGSTRRRAGDNRHKLHKLLLLVQHHRILGSLSLLLPWQIVNNMVQFVLDQKYTHQEKLQRVVLHVKSIIISIKFSNCWSDFPKRILFSDLYFFAFWKQGTCKKPMPQELNEEVPRDQQPTLFVKDLRKATSTGSRTYPRFSLFSLVFLKRHKLWETVWKVC